MGWLKGSYWTKTDKENVVCWLEGQLGLTDESCRALLKLTLEELRCLRQDVRAESERERLAREAKTTANRPR